ncbi:MAG: YhcN/YlaJ family sporulation lipoprotein [Bacillota bacterium]
MKNTRKYIKCVLFVLIMSLMAIGCTPAQRPVPEDNVTPDNVPDDASRDRYTDMGTYDDRDDLTDEFNIGETRPNQRPIVGPNNLIRDDNETITQNNNGRNASLETEVERIDGVVDAVVIVNNNTAYVGVDTDTTNNVLNAKGLQSEIARRVRSVMPAIDRVYVTSDEDRVTRLRDYTNRVRTRTGAWTRDMIDEIEDIF